MSDYIVDDEIAAFFTRTTATRSQCEVKARQITGSDKVESVAIQGSSSYTVYAGDQLEHVVQCRLRSSPVKTDMLDLAAAVHGASFVPTVSLHGELGHAQEHEDGKEPLLVYHMTRVPGVTQLDFVLSHKVPDHSPEFFPSRRNLIPDIASFFARSWLAPQHVSPEFCDNVKADYLRDLHALEEGLPERFQPAIQMCLRSLDQIMTLPMVLLHTDFRSCHLLVDKDSCHLNGVIDWADALIGPFGTNIHYVQPFVGSMHLHNGWSRFPDYEALEQQFWSTLAAEVGGLSEETVATIKKARVLGLLLLHGFTYRGANETAPTPLKDDEYGRYQMMYLDGYLVDPGTKIDGAF